MSEELTSCPKCEGLKPTATPVEILRAHESYLSYGFGYCGHLMDEHIAERMVRADRERAKRLEAALREADTALLRALSDLMGYEDGGRTATQDLVQRAADRAHTVLEEKQ